MIHGHCCFPSSSWEDAAGAGGACLEGVLRWTSGTSAPVPVAADLPAPVYFLMHLGNLTHQLRHQVIPCHHQGPQEPLGHSVTVPRCHSSSTTSRIFSVNTKKSCRPVSSPTGLMPGVFTAHSILISTGSFGNSPASWDAQSTLPASPPPQPQVFSCSVWVTNPQNYF